MIKIKKITLVIMSATFFVSCASVNRRLVELEPVISDSRRVYNDERLIGTNLNLDVNLTETNCTENGCSQFTPSDSYPDLKNLKLEIVVDYSNAKTMERSWVEKVPMREVYEVSCPKYAYTDECKENTAFYIFGNVITWGVLGLISTTSDPYVLAKREYKDTNRVKKIPGSESYTTSEPMSDELQVTVQLVPSGAGTILSQVFETTSNADALKKLKKSMQGIYTPKDFNNFNESLVFQTQIKGRGNYDITQIASLASLYGYGLKIEVKTKGKTENKFWNGFGESHLESEQYREQFKKTVVEHFVEHLESEQEQKKQAKAEKDEEQYQNSPERIRDLACISVALVSASKKSIVRERKIASVGGYENKTAIYKYSQSIVKCNEGKAAYEKQYREMTGKNINYNECEKGLESKPLVDIYCDMHGF